MGRINVKDAKINEPSRRPNIQKGETPAWASKIMDLKVGRASTGRTRGRKASSSASRTIAEVAVEDKADVAVEDKAEVAVEDKADVAVDRAAVAVEDKDEALEASSSRKRHEYTFDREHLLYTRKELVRRSRPEFGVMCLADGMDLAGHPHCHFENDPEHVYVEVDDITVEEYIALQAKRTSTTPRNKELHMCQDGDTVYRVLFQTDHFELIVIQKNGSLICSNRVDTWTSTGQSSSDAGEFFLQLFNDFWKGDYPEDELRVEKNRRE